MNQNPTPNPYTTKLKATVRVTNEHLAETDQDAERRSEANVKRAIHNALRKELGSGLEELEIEVEGTARRSDR